MCTRNAQHVSERGEDHVRLGGNLRGFIDQFDGRDAHRAAWAVQQRYLRWQQLIYAKFDDGVGLPAADFHQRPGPCSDPADSFSKVLRRFGIAVFVDIFHWKVFHFCSIDGCASGRADGSNLSVFAQLVVG